MKAVVTGGTGFIGSHLVPALKDAGNEVVITVESGGAEVPAGVRVFPADVSSGQGLPEALEGADVLVHLAARNHVLKDVDLNPLREYRRVNVEGTRNVVRAAYSAGIKLMIHMSSIKAMGEGADHIIDETSPCEPKSPYGISKLESENAARCESEKEGLRIVILRLPMVYGPGNRGNLPRMIRWADRGLPFPLFQPENLRSMVYVGNVVSGISAILKNPPVSTLSTIYMLKDREDYSTRTVYSVICRELRRNPLFFPIPAALVKFGRMISDDFRKVTGSFQISCEKIEKEIGFTPPYSLEEGMARTIRWYKDSAC